MTTPSQFTESVAAEVRAELARQGKKPADVEAALDMSRPTVAKRLRGEAPFDTRELALLSHWLDVPVERFIPRTTEGAA